MNVHNVVHYWIVIAFDRWKPLATVKTERKSCNKRPVVEKAKKDKRSRWNLQFYCFVCVRIYKNTHKRGLLKNYDIFILHIISVMRPNHHHNAYPKEFIILITGVIVCVLFQKQHFIHAHRRLIHPHLSR